MPDDTKTDADGEHQQLLLAYHSGHVDQVQAALASGASPNIVTKRRLTPLYVAARAGHAKIVELLLHAGAAVKPDSPYRLNPLYAAVRYGHEEAVQVLLRAKAQVSGPHSLLHTACKHSHVQVVEQLLRFGYDRVLPAERLHVFQWACQNNATRVGHAMLDQGLDMNERDRMSRCVLHVACAYGQSDLVTRLLKAGAPADTQDKFGHCAVHALVTCRSPGPKRGNYAMTNADWRLVQQLVLHGASALVMFPGNSNLFHVACTSGCKSWVVRMLRDFGVDVNLVNNDSIPPLKLAYLHCKPRTVLHLLRCGAQIAAGWGGSLAQATHSLLMFAFRHKHFYLVKYMCQHYPACLRKQLSYEAPPLMTAVRVAGVRIVRFMLTCGAPLSERENHGDSWAPLHVAAQLGHADIVRLLIQHGANVNQLAELGKTALYFACTQGHWEVVQELLAHGADPEAGRGHPNGLHALRMAASRRHWHIVCGWIENPAYPSYDAVRAQIAMDACRDGQCQVLDRFYHDSPHFICSALYLKNATIGGSLTAVQWLVEHGANVNVTDTHGWTPLHHACERGQLHILQFLLRHHIDTSVCRTPARGNPLQMAYDENHLPALAELARHGVSLQAISPFPGYVSATCAQLQCLAECGYDFQQHFGSYPHAVTAAVRQLMALAGSDATFSSMLTKLIALADLPSATFAHCRDAIPIGQPRPEANTVLMYSCVPLVLGAVKQDRCASTVWAQVLQMTDVPA